MTDRVLLQVHGDDWSVTITVIPSPEIDGLFHAFCQADWCESKDAALRAAQWALQMLAGGREAWIRVMPEATSDQDFDTKKWRHRGFTRFAFKYMPGDHKMMAQLADGPIAVPGFGAAVDNSRP